MVKSQDYDLRLFFPGVIMRRFFLFILVAFSMFTCQESGAEMGSTNIISFSGVIFDFPTNAVENCIYSVQIGIVGMTCGATGETAVHSQLSFFHSSYGTLSRLITVDFD